MEILGILNHSDGYACPHCEAEIEGEIIGIDSDIASTFVGIDKVIIIQCAKCYEIFWDHCSTEPTCWIPDDFLEIGTIISRDKGIYKAVVTT
ncbi:hypothetical protein LCGC14_1279020 [marine sediment metagenome]|uniref:Uncharacterized protein n=1 Tax=marine sediment metagenome TaxID=412755 RepID=A0A0F9KXI5_9ZZZZ